MQHTNAFPGSMPCRDRLVTCLAVPALALAAACSSGQSDAARSRFVYAGADGRLVYEPYNERGDRIPDFSTCGYGGGGVPIPDVAVAIAVDPAPGDGDDAPRLQRALDDLGRLPMDAAGFRGALLLRRGVYRLDQPLVMAASGVVLRGEGDADGGTLLVARKREAHAVVEIRGESGPRPRREAAVEIADPCVAVGATAFRIAKADAFAVGQTVLVYRRGNREWISAIGMDRITPRPGNPDSTKQWGPFDLVFDRVVTAVDGDRITLDAPVTCAIETRWGGGSVVPYDDPQRLVNVGVEHLAARSEYDAAVTAKLADGTVYAADEKHASRLVSMVNAKHVWIRNCSTQFFVNGVTGVGSGAKWVTVQDCRAVDPVSLITGGRRYPFSIAGQLVLMQRCESDGARHAFSFSSRLAGPNVFLRCRSSRDYGSSEPHHRWSVGGLFDGVDARIAIQDRQWMGTGHGWSGANYVVWNCTGALVCQEPPTAQNLAIGFVGERAKAAFDRPDGLWESHGRQVTPESLYEAQLADRLR